MSVIKQIQELYKLIPSTANCQKNCSICCGPIPISKEESDYIQKKYNIVIGVDSELNCNCIDKKNNNCKIYQDRPFICRLYNETNYGTLYCTEINNLKPLTNEYTKEIFENYIELVGTLIVTCSDLQSEFRLSIAPS